MNLPTFVASFTASLNPTASVAITLPTFTPLVGIVGPLSATVTVTLPSVFMANLNFSFMPSGGAKVGGGAAIFGDPLICVGDGGVVVSGGADIVVPLLAVVSGTGGTKVSGVAAVTSYSLSPTLSVTFPPAVISLAGVTSILVSIFPPLEVSGSGYQGNVGNLATSLPGLRASLDGGIQSMSVELPALRSALTGFTAVTGRLSARFPTLGVSASGEVTALGGLFARFPVLQAQAAGLVGSIGRLSVTIPVPQAALTGQLGTLGVLSLSLPHLASSLTGYSRIEGSLSAVFPAMQADLVGTMREQLRLFLVANTVTAAVTTYSGIAPNSMAQFNGQSFFADSTGIHVVDADDDNGALINAQIVFGKNDLGSRVQKRVVDAYIGLRATGDMSVSVSADEQTPYTYVLGTESVTRLKERRVKLGRGAKGMYWQFSVKNNDGCDFAMDKIELPVQDNDRKI